MSLIEKDAQGKLIVPDAPTIPFIEGDGVGPDIWAAARPVLDAAVQKAYQGKRRIDWIEILAGEKALAETGQYLPEETLTAIGKYRVAIKGPLTTPVGKGFRSLNVALRMIFDLYACIRPVAYIPGVPSPVKHPEKVDMVVFRENTEDVYAGIEWEKGSPEAAQVAEFMEKQMGVDPKYLTGGIGLKVITENGAKRLVRRAVEYAIAKNRRSVTLVHKGNIMKFTEGAFRKWGYEAALEFEGQTITEDELFEKYNGQAPAGKIVIKDRIADAMFQMALLRPDEFDLLATPNLNGDYLSDALAAQVGGLGMAPGANVGDETAVFEATHGSAPKYTGQDKVNPGSVILSGALMLEHLGWDEAAARVRKALGATIAAKQVTYDLARQIEGAKELKCSEFGQAVVGRI